MFVRTFRPDRFLRSVYNSMPFADYCRERSIPFGPIPGTEMQPDDIRRWTAAIATLPDETQIQVELDLTKANELSDGDSLAHLLDAIDGKEPPPASIPGGAALALWFLLHYPDIFHEVLLQEEIQEVESWRIARGKAGIALEDLPGKAAALGSSLREFFAMREGTGRFCTVDAHQVKDACCFIAYLADRVQLLDGFTDGGEHTTQRLRPAFPVTFVYYPDDGTLLLNSRLRAQARVLELFQQFGKDVLGIELTERDLSQGFDLDRLKKDYPLLADADDMEMVRLKSLHLRYPERHGRRQVKLETLVRDEVSAIAKLLKAHEGGEAVLEQLRVSYAELQVRLRVEGRSKSYVIRLWPNRCNLSQTPLGARFRTCLKRWGLLHVRQS